MEGCKNIAVTSLNSVYLVHANVFTKIAFGEFRFMPTVSKKNTR